jgi:prepilin-type N-terminal cleavage/methylation domain-containing protein
MKEKTKNIKIFSKGFTLIEALVAIAILSLSILAAFTAIQGNLQKVNVTQNKVVSYYLAGEAIEFIRNLRDENAIANFRSIETGGSAVGWLSGMSACVGQNCYIDSPAKILTTCSCNFRIL